MFISQPYHHVPRYAVQCVESRDSSVSMVTRLRAGKLMNCDPMSVKDKRFFSSAKHVDRLWGPPQPPIQWVLGLFLLG